MFRKLFSAGFLLLSLLTVNAQAYHSCRSDFDCGRDEQCIRVPGDNNNFCSYDSGHGRRWSCQDDRDCGRHERCVRVQGRNNNYCERVGRGGWSCSNDRDCYRGERCIKVPGDNNNYCSRR